MLFLNLCKAFDSGREKSRMLQKVTGDRRSAGRGHKDGRQLKDIMNRIGKKEWSAVSATSSYVLRPPATPPLYKGQEL